jgi:chemotaxis protein MotB
MSGTGAQPVIIKKVKKKGHEAGHGGSWKVAYADFVTAMMAFFLLLWLVSMVSEDQRARVSEYFKSFNLFDKSGQSFVLENKIAKAKIDIGASEGDANNSQDSKVGGNGTNIFSTGGTVTTADAIKEGLKKEVEEKLTNMKDQVLVDIVDGAVRIEVVDKSGGSAMFNSGSREMTEEGKMALRVIADSIKGLKGRIAIEGHTDASNYAGSAYSNWELSTDRASAARRELENRGMSPDRLIRVAGYAATDPLIKDDPYNPKNRRISIRVFPDENGNLPANLSGGQKGEGKNNVSRSGSSGGGGKAGDPIDNYLMNK